MTNKTQKMEFLMGIQIYLDDIIFAIANCNAIKEILKAGSFDHIMN